MRLRKGEGSSEKTTTTDAAKTPVYEALVGWGEQTGNPKPIILKHLLISLLSTNRISEEEVYGNL